MGLLFYNLNNLQNLSDILPLLSSFFHKISYIIAITHDTVNVTTEIMGTVYIGFEISFVVFITVLHKTDITPA